MLINRRLQRGIGFTNHALERFVERAGLRALSWREAEAVLRDLLDQEGRVVYERPRWARSRNTADAYIQVGEWLLLICRNDDLRRGAVRVVTIVNGPEGNTWQRALELGYIATPLPQHFSLPQKPYISFWDSVKIARRADSPDQPSIFSRVIEIHRIRRAKAQAIYYEEAVRNHRERIAAYEAQRRHARESHELRYGASNG